ncbi:MAG: YqeG family HAD IIIA-type phosphatase [Planctomycetaceae bacterium]|nr:YqeG family HAD IIIA-type phosphatase [Planctomycetaceae bacterium]
MFSLFQPHLILDSIFDVTPELLQQHGLRSLLLDVDSTLKRYRATEIPLDAVQWIESLQKSGIAFCLLSNGREPRIRPIAEQVKLPFIAPAMKPMPFGCWKAIKANQFNTSETAIIGDQIFADILAGKFAKIFTILVTPINPEEEHWYTRMKRPFERWVINRQSLARVTGSVRCVVCNRLQTPCNTPRNN